MIVRRWLEQNEGLELRLILRSIDTNSSQSCVLILDCHLDESGCQSGLHCNNYFAGLQHSFKAILSYWFITEADMRFIFDALWFNHRIWAIWTHCFDPKHPEKACDCWGAFSAINERTTRVMRHLHQALSALIVLTKYNFLLGWLLHREGNIHREGDLWQLFI